LIGGSGYRINNQNPFASLWDGKKVRNPHGRPRPASTRARRAAVTATGTPCCPAPRDIDVGARADRAVAGHDEAERVLAVVRCGDGFISGNVEITEDQEIADSVLQPPGFDGDAFPLHTGSAVDLSGIGIKSEVLSKNRKRAKSQPCKCKERPERKGGKPWADVWCAGVCFHRE
jgi:hypothetical protein